MDLIRTFRAARFELSLRALDPLVLPLHAGSTLRGAFGRVFRGIGCIASRLGSGDCTLGDRCPYHYVFETRVPTGSAILTKVESAPRPFVIEPPHAGARVHEPGTLLRVGLVLIGRAIDYLPYFVFAFEELGKARLGPGGGRCRLESVATAPLGQPSATIYTAGARRLVQSDVVGGADDRPPAPPGSAGRVTIEFLTPTRLQYAGGPASATEFHILFRNVLRRVSFLNYFHCDGDLLDDGHARIEAAKVITTVHAGERWRAWERYSARQRQRVPMTGFTGRVTYEGDLTPFWPWLALGELVHVGKGATFGLGRYRLRIQGSY